MGQILHGSATTTEAFRRAIQHSQENLRQLASATGGIEHRLTKVTHPWTNSQVERMNRTIKEATVKRFHYDDHRQFKTHLADFVAAYNFGRRSEDAVRPYPL